MARLIAPMLFWPLVAGKAHTRVQEFHRTEDDQPSAAQPFQQRFNSSLAAYYRIVDNPSNLPGPMPVALYLQNGTSEVDEIYAAVVVEGDTVVLAGYTFGNWTRAHGGDNDTDFAAVKLDGEGNYLWSWQVLARRDRVLGAVIP